MQKQFSSVLDFIQSKENCLFCQTKLRACLTNFIGTRKNGLPILNATADKHRFGFEINHTTESYDIKANGMIDIVTNKLVFTVPPDSATPIIDQRVAKQAFIDLKPHFELHCPNKKCKHRYSLTTYIINVEKISGAVAWSIWPLKIFLESFRADRYLVQNDWIKEDTNIYLLNNEDTEPIKAPFMDFEEMGKDKLLNRIKTLVTFS